ncbi:MAG: TonB-dependent receptor [Ignavibacteriaceae bacterium]|nr:TonB-dependent receptor [Ignavibacteriaceae bacterium]
MIRKTLIILIFTAAALFSSDAGSAKITGRIIEKSTGKPLEYANILLLNRTDSSMIAGTVSGLDGVFLFPKVIPGRYLIDVRFIGYDDVFLEVSALQADELVNLGDIFLASSSLKLDDVVVQGDRSPITYMTDKKVIDVSQMQPSVSGTAAEVLENIPSVTVDIEGNVSLRGSQSFTVLINGKVSPMDAQDILQQIPASSIDRIEIITNPSSRFEAQGTAGVINIILKESTQLGLSGFVNANTGLNDKYGGDMLFDYSMTDLSAAVSIDYNRRFSPGDSRQTNRYYSTGSYSEFLYDGTSTWGRTSYGLRGSLMWKASPADEFSFGFYTGHREGENSSLSTIRSRYISSGLDSSDIYNESGFRSRGGDVARFNLDYSRGLGREGHELILSLSYHTHNSEESTLSNLLRNGQQFDGRNSTEAGPSEEYELKADYVLPYGLENALEAGYLFSTEISDEETGLFEYSSSSGSFQRLSLFDRYTVLTETDQGIYTQVRHYIGNLGLQAGVRAEYTYRNVDERLKNLITEVEDWDIFPTFFSSYKFAEGHQITASFTRRVERPGGWELEPFETFTDANNVRIGNPELLNEYINSYEAGFQTFIRDISISGEVFYRHTMNKIEGLSSLYAPGITLQKPYNVGEDYSTGTELMILVDPFAMWNVNLMGTLYDYRIKGQADGTAFERTATNWNLRAANTFKFTPVFQMQVNAGYTAPSVSSQGNTSASFSTDLAAKYDLFDKRLSLTLQMRDIFGTAKREHTRQSATVYRYEYNVRESPMVMLNIRYNINRSEKKDKGGRDMNNGDGGEEF